MIMYISGSVTIEKYVYEKSDRGAYLSAVFFYYLTPAVSLWNLFVEILALMRGSV